MTLGRFQSPHVPGYPELAARSHHYADHSSHSRLPAMKSMSGPRKRFVCLSIISEEASHLSEYANAYKRYALLQEQTSLRAPVLRIRRRKRPLLTCSQLYTAPADTKIQEIVYGLTLIQTLRIYTSFDAIYDKHNVQPMLNSFSHFEWALTFVSVLKHTGYVKVFRVSNMQCSPLLTAPREAVKRSVPYLSRISGFLLASFSLFSDVHENLERAHAHIVTSYSELKS